MKNKIRAPPVNIIISFLSILILLSEYFFSPVLAPAPHKQYDHTTATQETDYSAKNRPLLPRAW
jgi:hypothetical protein